MKKRWIFMFLPLMLISCVATLFSPAAPVPTPTPIVTPTPTPAVTLTPTPTTTITATPTITLTPTPLYPVEGYGSTGFPQNVNPLTGLVMIDPARLERRPIIVKVANLPRAYRPQWGLSLADQVFEYYIEEGTTRFAAIYLGQDADMVGPIRSGRFFDNHLISMYKANFAFGSADYRVRNLLFNQDYANRLVIESGCPPMCRFEPHGVNYLMANTADLTTLIDQRNVEGGNGRQNLDGFLFNYKTPVEGQPVSRIFVRYSAAIYNRWDYNLSTGVYDRFSDVKNDFENGKGEEYQQLTDRLTGGNISAENVVILYVPHNYFSKQPEIVDIVMSGPGAAYLFRDGKAFELRWYRNAFDQTFILVSADGKPFPLKPGTTWFEVLGSSSELQTASPDWRFYSRCPDPSSQISH